MREGWQSLPLGELCDVLDHKRKPITKRDREAGEYPYYGATGVLDRVAGYLFDEPLVLVSEDGAKWGSGENTAFAVEGRVWVNNHAHVLRPNRDKLLDRWLIYHLNHSDLSAFVSGLTVPKLNQGSLREIPVPVPPHSPNSSESSPCWTKRLRASPPPKPTPNGTSRTPEQSLRVIFNPSSVRGGRSGLRRSSAMFAH